MTLHRRTVLTGAIGLGLTGAALAQTPPPHRPGGPAPAPADPTETIDLWPNGAPGAPAVPLIEVVDERSADPALRDRAVHGISRPRMVVFRPRKPNGSAVLVMPGGGYRWVVIDKEGYEIARWLAEHGWTVFVLFYRLPGDGWAAGPDVALSDAQRAIRLIRAWADQFGLHRDHVVAMGFSAGGHVCGDLATRHGVRTYAPFDSADALDSRPDLSALLYPVQSMSEPLAHPGSRSMLLGPDPTPSQERAHTVALNVTTATPPTFLVHAEDDTSVPVGNTLELRAALTSAGVSVDTHLFATGGHGFGLRRAIGKPAAAWPQLFKEWAASHLASRPPAVQPK